MLPGDSWEVAGGCGCLVLGSGLGQCRGPRLAPDLDMGLGMCLGLGMGLGLGLGVGVCMGLGLCQGLGQCLCLGDGPGIEEWFLGSSDGGSG